MIFKRLFGVSFLFWYLSWHVNMSMLWQQTYLDICSSQRSVFTRRQSRISLTWHFLLVQPPERGQGSPTLLSWLWHYISLVKFPFLSRCFIYLCRDIEKILWPLLTLNVPVYNRNWEPLRYWQTFGTSFRGTVSCSVLADLLLSLGWIFKAFDSGVLLSRSEILPVFLFPAL